jgi:hypothetical protein
MAQERPTSMGGQQSRSSYCLILVSAKHVGNSCGGKSTSGESHTRGYINANPQSPGMLIVQVAYDRQASKVAGNDKTKSNQHDSKQNQDTRGPESNFKRGRFGVSMRTHM